MAINVGSAFAYAFLTTLGTNGGMGIPKERIGRWRLELGMDDSLLFPTIGCHRRPPIVTAAGTCFSTRVITERVSSGYWMDLT